MIRNKPIKQPLTEIQYDFDEDWLGWFESIKTFVNQIWTRQAAYIANYHTPIYITTANSPFTPTEGQYKIIADTDGGAITVNLPTLPFNHGFKIKNSGSSGNNVILSGSNPIEDTTIADGQAADLEGTTSSGWVWM